MNKQRLLKIINPVMLVLFVSIITTALAKNSLSHTTYYYFHMIPGLALGALGLLHVILNLNWLKAAYFSKKR